MGKHLHKTCDEITLPCPNLDSDLVKVNLLDCYAQQLPFLLIWFNFNPNMDK